MFEQLKPIGKQTCFHPQRGDDGKRCGEKKPDSASGKGKLVPRRNREEPAKVRLHDDSEQPPGRRDPAAAHPPLAIAPPRDCAMTLSASSTFRCYSSTPGPSPAFAPPLRVLSPKPCQFYARKAPEIGPRKAIIALARKLLIVAWRMLLTGEVYRAARATTVARKHREVQKKIRIQMPSMVPVQNPACTTQRPRAYAGGTEGPMSRRRTLVSS